MSSYGGPTSNEIAPLELPHCSGYTEGIVTVSKLLLTVYRKTVSGIYISLPEMEICGRGASSKQTAGSLFIIKAASRKNC